MRCPKCHYLSFEPEARCRNCGYDLSLAEDELLIKAVDEDESDALMQDFDLHERPIAAPAVPITLGPMHLAADDEPDDHAPAVATAVAVAPPPPPAARPVRPPSTTTELPLFMRAAALHNTDVDTLLIQMPAVPRPPLAVRRRPSEEPVRLERTSMNSAASNIESVWAPLPAAVSAQLEGDHSVEPESDPEPDVAPSRVAAREAVESTTDVPLSDRLTAGGIDLALLAGINGVVLWLTLKVCAVPFGDLLTLPITPLALFFMLVDAGYLLLFTAASGQTLGKMAAHIRVVDATDEQMPEPLSLRQAVLRSLVALPSGLAFGAGFLPALGGHGASIHDRLAHTRIVRA